MSTERVGSVSIYRELAVNLIDGHLGRQTILIEASAKLMNVGATSPS